MTPAPPPPPPSGSSTTSTGSATASPTATAPAQPSRTARTPTPASPARTSRPRPCSCLFTGARPRPTGVSSPKLTPTASSASPRTCAASRPAWRRSSPPSKHSTRTVPAMTRADNSAYLAQANARRHQAALAAAGHAIEQLQREGKAINYTTVARTAGVSRPWLHRQDQIRDLTSQLREQRPAAPLAAQRASTDSLRQRLDTARAKITRLRGETRSPRDQIARQLGLQRTQPATGQRADHLPKPPRQHVPAA